MDDYDLLAACLSAGEPGTESHRLACRLYRQSVIEWRARAARSVRANSDFSELLALVAGVAAMAGWLDECGCGTHSGYNRHVREGTPACPACAEAEREYSRERQRARRAGIREQEAA